MAARRDIRRFRPDPVPDEVIARILRAAHHAPSVGHSQPWRFILVSDPGVRARAALMADRSRLAQSARMTPEASRRLLDLDLEGIREAPFGLVVCCDRRAVPDGVLGRATFTDADMWSCACAIENLWLVARAEGLGVGWVTLFEPEELARLVEAPEGVATLGWLCVGWPDERPPDPGLERRGWSVRLDLDQLVIRERWPVDTALGWRARRAVFNQRAAAPGVARRGSRSTLGGGGARLRGPPPRCARIARRARSGWSTSFWLSGITRSSTTECSSSRPATTRSKGSASPPTRPQ